MKPISQSPDTDALNRALDHAKTPEELAGMLTDRALQSDHQALLQLCVALIMELCAREAMERQKLRDRIAKARVN